MAEQLDVIIRFHDIARISELKRCVFSLVGQSYRPLRLIVALQRFSETDIAAMRAALAPLLGGADAPDLAVVNWENTEPVDARSVLLNLGVQVAQGRYLAYLDYDDVLYPEAYTLMVSQLKAGGAAIAFAAVRVMRLQVYDQFFYTAEKATVPFSGKNLMDLFRNNFCPLHSYVIDRAQLTPDILSFNPSLLMEEDYDVLLRICARYASDFTLIDTQIGDYYYKSDGSNTVPTGGALTQAIQDRYKNVRLTIEHRKRTTVVAGPVQRLLGLPASAGPITIRDIIDRFS